MPTASMAPRLHLFATDGARVLACARIFAPGVRRAEAVIGRVVTSPSLRRSGVGRELMRRAVAAVSRSGTAAVAYLARRAEVPGAVSTASFGFVRDGDDYDEDGIPHLPMRRAEDRRSRV